MTSATIRGKATPTDGVPAVGQVVTVRNREWIVTDVVRSSIAAEEPARAAGAAAPHLISLVSVDHDAPTRSYAWCGSWSRAWPSTTSTLCPPPSPAPGRRLSLPVRPPDERSAVLGPLCRVARRGRLPRLQGRAPGCVGETPRSRRAGEDPTGGTPVLVPGSRHRTAVARGIRYVLLHTIAHTLIRGFALECGYGASGIAERVYARSGEEPMAGILLYTAAPDSEGTLGGLVSLGHRDRLGPVIDQALEEARLCSSDPMCAEHDPRIHSRLHGAACQACLFAAETSCERGNHYLDRSLLVETLAGDLGAFLP
ncbi:DUF1998 domain-containing protein [Streptomyces caniferus]|uniref:DUF1998 domain-containing protein n=1 Tax=Streptomyces caniferus TaxID=285557 RepID=UPI003451D760